MASVHSIYAADPAYPILACSLLTEPESIAKNYEYVSSREVNPEDWSLQTDWTAGLQSAKTNVFHSGKVIGFSRLRNKSNDSNEYITQVSSLLFISLCRF